MKANQVIFTFFLTNPPKVDLADNNNHLKILLISNFIRIIKQHTLKPGKSGNLFVYNDMTLTTT